MPRRSRTCVDLSPELLEDRANPVSFSTTDGYWIGSNVLTVAVGDITGDGKLDIVAGTGDSTRVNVLINDGTGEFTRGANVPIPAPFGVELADMDGDGKLDILVGNAYGEQVAIARGNGDGTFQTPIYHNIGQYAQDVAVADFNGDGRLDVVAVNGGAAVMLNDGSANILGAPTFYNVSPDDGSYVAAGDFNGDGKPDFALTRVQENLTDIYLNNGDGTFGTPTSYANPVSNQTDDIIAGDFNNDGHLDLAVGYYYHSGIGLLVGNGDGTFQSAVIIDSSLDWVGRIAAADFNMDGNLDIAVMEARNGSEAVLLGNGAGGFGPPVHVIDSWAGDLVVADINADGLPDIVTGHALSAGLVSISINTTQVSTPAAFSFTVTAPTSATPGESFTITVTAKDQFGDTLNGYTGIVHFTSTDSLAGLPADYQFVAGDNGTKTFTVTLNTVGSWTITVTDKVTGIAAGTSDSITVNPIVSPVLADFGANGLWYLDANGWVQLSPANVQSAALSADGTTVVADFGTAGLKRWTVADGWTTISPANAIRVSMSDDGSTVVADFGFGGLKRWTESEGWTRLARGFVRNLRITADGETVVADFGFGGLKRWTVSDAWTRLTWASAENVVISEDANTVVGDYGFFGLWKWTIDSGWSRLTWANAHSLNVSADGETITADFGAGGLKQWTANDGWVKIFSANAQHVAVSADGSTIVADFGTAGLWKWTATSGTWVQLATENVQKVAVTSDGKAAVADFGSNGIRAYLDSWTQLSLFDPECIWLV